MAKLYGVLKKMQGNAGQLSFRQLGNETVVSERIYKNKSAGDGATLAQREHRCKVANIVNFYRAIIEFEKRAWEGKPENVSDYNMFVKNNVTNNNNYLPKNFATVGACVPGRYVVAKGKLSPVAISPIFGAGVNSIQTQLAVGTLPVGSDYTVGVLSQAIIDNNAGYNNGDKITFGFIRKRNETIGGVTYPFIDVEYIEMQLDTESEVIAADLWFSRNFSYGIADNAISFDGSADGVFAVHTRMLGSELLASNQVVVLPASQTANPYGTEAWIQACCDSYGYKGDVLIQPSEVQGSSVIRVQVTAVAGDNGTVSGGGQAVAGRSVTVRATPNSGYAFKGWYDNAAGAGEPLSTSAVYTFTAPEQDMTIYALFAETVTVEIDRPANGSITANGEMLVGTGVTSVTVAKGGLLTLKATPGNGYQFSKWQKGEGTQLSTENPYSFVVNESMTGSSVITVIFVAGGPAEG